ncbi:Hypothetical protein, putative [Bodo saltans]|uniref:Uncharacterized protein n=1 Tax=Bodo saltans TaxID=75058 RepID=A0A0S4KGX8_BODSA|nr:Hypothetical protein, putative [Bodo saltans]|eukprot:CUI14970.1 Hypothetical protein, putative [Bodo saltans]
MGQSCSPHQAHTPRAGTRTPSTGAITPRHNNSDAGVNVHAVLHDWAVRDEIRLRAQQQVIADRLERSRQQRILPPPCSSHSRSPQGKQLHNSLELSSITLTATAATPRSSSLSHTAGKLSSAACTPVHNPLLPQ